MEEMENEKAISMTETTECLQTFLKPFKHDMVIIPTPLVSNKPPQPSPRGQ